jgi:2-succinyl-5-enolpyruvyl-6-hydroxy-3-cyclohexene-1-carboxylate synthase
VTHNPHLAVVNDFIDGLAESGLEHFVVSPGSRSTPLTMTLARRDDIRVWTVLDERSAGFFALGLAKASRTPVGLLCTSGTATANYLPAIMEAFHSEVPLLVVTADRPTELYGVGSNQTVDQMKLYGGSVKAFYQMPVPDGYPALGSHAKAMAYRAMLKMTSAPQGPVQVNWPFREPLVPPYIEKPSRLSNGSDDGPQSDTASSCVAPILNARRTPDEQTVRVMQRWLAQARRGLIICGPQDDPDFIPSVLRVSERYRIPILADPLSQLRFHTRSGALVIDSYDILFRESDWFDELCPDLIVRFGRTVTSKALGLYLSHHRNVRQVVVTEGEDWHDPWFCATHIVQARPADLCNGICSGVIELAAEFDAQAKTEWLDTWSSLQAKIHQEIEDFTDSLGDASLSFEGRVFTELPNLMTDGMVLMVGNSMPIRDMDSFWRSDAPQIRTLANRGASGIDGVVSTAIGAAAANVGHVTLVVGDVSFYHDLNALQIALAHQIDITIVLMNNQGGGIFAFLPQASYPDEFQYFQTPHTLSFQPVVEMFGGRYVKVKDWDDFVVRLRSSYESGGIHVIEVQTDTDKNVRLHRTLFERIQKSLRQEG